MVNGLDSAREQLQWRLNYADKISHIGVGGFPECSYLFTQRTAFQSLRTEETKTDATASQSVAILQQAGAIEGQSKVAHTGDPG